MKKYNLEVWYRCNDEKDFYHASVEAESFEQAEKEIRSKDKRIFKVEQV